MKNVPRNVTGAAVMAIAVTIIVLLFFVPLPQGNDEVALVVLGIAIGWASNVVQFHFGTSEGSKQKTDLLSERPSGTPGDPVHVEDDTLDLTGSEVPDAPR